MNETAEKEAVHTALAVAHDEYAELERTAMSVCQELEGAGALSGSSVASRLRALGGRITEHTKSTFCLGVLRALVVPRHTTTWTSGWCLDTHHTPLPLLHSLHSL